MDHFSSVVDSFVGNAFRVVIDDFAFDASDRFTYEYNFFEH